MCEFGLRQVLGNLAIAGMYDVAPADGRCLGLKPGFSTEYTGMQLAIPPVRQEVNELGFRGPPRPRTHPAGTTRIAMLGDSFTYGVTVREADSIPAIVEAELNAAGRPPTEVLNFGMPGVQLHDIVPQFERFAAAFHPDVVVVLVEPGDFEWNEGHPNSMCDMLEIPAAARAIAQHVYLSRLLLIPYFMLRPHGSGEGAPVEEFQTELRGIIETVARHHAKLAFVDLAGTPRLRDSTVERVVTAMGVPFVRVAEDDRALRTPRDGHYNATGTRSIGRRLAAWLAFARLVPPPIDAR